LRSKLNAIARRRSRLSKGGAAGLTSNVRGTLVGTTSQTARGAWLLTSLRSGTVTPASGEFNIVIRNYWPKREAFDGTYKNPPIKRVQ